MIIFLLLTIITATIFSGMCGIIGLAIVAVCIAIRIAREISRTEWAENRRMAKARRNREKLKGEKHNGK